MMSRLWLPRFYVYLLLSERGEVYTGFTSDLRRRLAEHNAVENAGWTRGRRWHLLAVRRFFDRHSALIHERRLKQSRFDKRNWLRYLSRSNQRLAELCRRHGIEHRLVRS